MRSAASSSRTEEEATEEEATADAAKEEAGLAFAFARRALTSAGTDAGAAAPQARSILPLRFVQQVDRNLWIGISSCTT